MYELIQVGENTFYINCGSKIGVYRFNDTEVCLIDSGHSEKSGRETARILKENGWTPSMILHTHMHADHTAGTAYLQSVWNVPAYVYGDIDAAFMRSVKYKPAYLFGGFPCDLMLESKVLCDSSCKAQELTDDIIPDGFETVRLDGHAFAMAAIRTPDDIWFMGDAVVSKDMIESACVCFAYDVEKYLESLDIAKGIKGKLFIPSHSEPTDDLSELIDLNRKQTIEISNKLLEICKEPLSSDMVMKKLYDSYGREITFNQAVLSACTIRSYLAYHTNAGRMELIIKDNLMMWHTV